MYFIPQKNKWYSRIIHVKPLYRYGVLFVGSCLIFLFWYYGLYVWLQAAIQQELASIARMESQIVQQGIYERQQCNITQKISTLNNACTESGRCCFEDCCHERCLYIFELIKKSGLRLVGYQADKEKKKQSWRYIQTITINLVGSLEQLQQFLMNIQKSARMTQCTSLSLQQTEENIFSFCCTIQFIRTDTKLLSL